MQAGNVAHAEDRPRVAVRAGRGTELRLGDGLFDAVKAELAKLIASGDEAGECALNLLMIAKYLERIGDNAVNVAEWIIFSDGLEK